MPRFIPQVVPLAILLVLSTSVQSEEKDLIKTWDFLAGADGWDSRHQCEASATGGSLHIRGTGNDPFLSTSIQGPAGWKTLTIRTRFEGTLNSQLFWTTVKRIQS